MKKLIILITAITLISACQKKDEVNPSQTYGSLKLSFDNVVGANDLVLNATKYLNANGDTFTVSTCKYYISNLKLRRKSDQVWITLPKTYQLIEESVKDNFTIDSVVTGEFDKVEFALGLDSVTNFGTNFNGDLNKSKAMYWEWNPQYVFLKLEGNRYYNATSGGLVFHIAGQSNLKTIQLPISSTLTSKNTVNVALKTDIYKMFDSPNKIDFSVSNNVMDGATVGKIAENYAQMFSIK